MLIRGNFFFKQPWFVCPAVDLYVIVVLDGRKDRESGQGVPILVEEATVAARGAEHGRPGKILLNE